VCEREREKREKRERGRERRERERERREREGERGSTCVGLPRISFETRQHE
jgi:hypothetical protein